MVEADESELALGTIAAEEGPGMNQPDRPRIVAALLLIAIRCRGKLFSVETWMLIDLRI